MAQQGTSPVPSQDDPVLSNISPTASSKTPRTLSFISNVQTAVAQIEDKLATSPSAYPPPPSRNEIPVTPPGPDDPVIDRVQFLESSLAMSPLNRTKIPSLAESAFGGVINPDPSLASTGVFVSTTPPTNTNQTASDPSGRQAATDILNDVTATVDTRAVPSIAPIVEQFETPVTPVISKENDSEIVGAPIAPIVEHFEGPTTSTSGINEQDLVEFASGMVGPVADQFESSTRTEPEASSLEQKETENVKQKAADYQNLGVVEQREAPQHEALVTVKSDSAGSMEKDAQSTTRCFDNGSQDGFCGVQNLPAIPVVEGLDALPESSENEGVSKDEIVRKDAVTSITELLTVPTEDDTTAIFSNEDDVLSNQGGPSLAKASIAEPGTVQRDAEATSETSESKSTALAANCKEMSEEYKADKPNEPSESDLPLSSEATSLPAVAKEEDSFVDEASKTVPATETINSEIDDISSIDDDSSPKETEKGIDLVGAHTIAGNDALVQDDSKETETETTTVTNSHATDENDDPAIDGTDVQDIETEKVATVTADGEEDKSIDEGCTSNETAKAVPIDSVNSKNDHSSTSESNASANETTTTIVTETVNSNDGVSPSGAVVDIGVSVDETTKLEVSKTMNSDEGVNSSADKENEPNEVSKAIATKIVDSSSEKSTTSHDSTMTDEARIPHVREILDARAEDDMTTEVQTSGPSINVDLPVTAAIPEHRSSDAPENMRSTGRFVGGRNILTSTATNRSRDATNLVTEVGAPDIQLDNSMNITIVVQTTSTPVSAGVTINTDDSARAGNQPTPRNARTVSGGVPAPAEDYASTALGNHETNEESATVIEATQECDTSSATKPAITSAEKEAVECVKENEVTDASTNKTVSHDPHEEQSAASEQDSLDTVATRAMLARGKLATSCPDGEVKTPHDSSLRTDSQPQAEELKSPGMLETSRSSSTITSVQSLPRRESIRSKSSTHAELRSTSSSSSRTKVGTGSRTDRQSVTRGATKLSFATKKRLAAASSMQKQEKKPPQSAPVSPLRLPKSSSNSVPRLPRVAGLSNTRSGSTMRSRPSSNDHTSGQLRRSSTFTSSVPKPNSRLSSPILPRRSGLTSSPATPKSTSKPSGTPRMPLRRTLSFANSKMFDSPSPASSRTRYSLSQKVEEMRRASSQRASGAHLSGSGSKPPLGRRPRVTVPEPFALFGPELHEMSEKQMDDARRKQAEEAARPRVFKPRPLPNFLKADTSQSVQQDETEN